MATTEKIVTGKVRFSYAHVFQPQAAMEGGVPKYSVSIIIPKSDKETVARFNKAFKDVTEANVAVFGGSVPKLLKGDEAYANSYFINANSGQKPGVVDADMNAIIDAGEFYSGCYGRASVTLYAYNSNGSKGIACGLNNVQKLEDGEKLGGSSSAASDFAI